MNQDIKTLIYPVPRCAAFFLQLLGVDPYVEQPYYVAFRLGDQEICLDAMVPVLERTPLSPAQHLPFV
jgi:hypothetical protein